MDHNTAKAQGLLKIVRNKLYLGVDHTNVLNTSIQGRNAIRLESKDVYNSGLLIADFAHMPANQCGVWPALCDAPVSCPSSWSRRRR